MIHFRCTVFTELPSLWFLLYTTLVEWKAGVLVSSAEGRLARCWLLTALPVGTPCAPDLVVLIRRLRSSLKIVLHMGTTRVLSLAFSARLGNLRFLCNVFFVSFVGMGEKVCKDEGHAVTAVELIFECGCPQFDSFIIS